jgi:hypothetical protein
LLHARRALARRLSGPGARGARLTRLFLLSFAMVVTVLAPERARADEARQVVVVELLPDAREIGSDALREAIAEELDVDAVAEDDPRAPAATRTLVIGEDRPKNELFVELREGAVAIARHVPLPRDARTARKTAVFLAGNMARNEASELVAERIRRDRDARPVEPEAATRVPAEAMPARESAPPRMRFWIGVTGELDLQMLPAASDVCLLGASAMSFSGYACTNADGTDYPSRVDRSQNDLIVAGKADSVSGGLASGNRRLGVSVDLALTENLLVGARVAYVLGRVPGASPPQGAFSPLHVELRATYVFGERPLSTSGFAFYALAGAGLAEFDGHVTVTVVEQGVLGARTVEAWKAESPLFVTAGLGVRWAMTPSTAILLAPLKGTLSIEHATPVLSPELGVQIAL